MQPTIQEGNRIVVNKMAYDLRLPFTEVILVSLATPQPQRGEIVVFESKAADLRLIKRVIGLPGDIVSITDEVVEINGQKLSYEPSSKSILQQGSSKVTTAIERLGAIQHLVNIDNNASNRLSNFAATKVPAGHYLVLGDNRRHSADSRIYGFVPHHEYEARPQPLPFLLITIIIIFPARNASFKIFMVSNKFK